MKRERAFAGYRQKAGLSLHRAATRLRISPGYLRALERGRVPLSLALAQRMAGEYGARIDDLTRTATAGGTGAGREMSGNVPRPARRKPLEDQ
jgi:transcriptional regulator with XRE-family HTH domain